jgi:alanine or glycine:cation symporter, AGCS family
MEGVIELINTLNDWVWATGIPVAGETIPFVVIALLGTGVFLTFRLKVIQTRRLAHGFAVTSGKYDDPSEPGDVSHFQALSTALSATVGIGNIAGVAIAIHWGGPGALFWMWVTAFLGMAVKYSEVTLAQHYRKIIAVDRDPKKWEGTVAGGPMYYIERGLGPSWKPLAVFFALMLGLTAFLTGNAVQANTLAETMLTTFGIEKWITGLISATIVGLVIVGGITRIGAVTGVLAPLMAAIYVGGALFIIAMHLEDVVPSFALIFREAFNPTAGVAGTGTGAFLVTLMWGVRRGLFSNEAGQGSAPIAHAAAKTDEPVSEGVVALLEPFIDTIIICTMTGLVIVMTGVWQDRHPTTIPLNSANIVHIGLDDDGRVRSRPVPAQIEVQDGFQVVQPGGTELGWFDVPVARFYIDQPQTQPFTGVIYPGQARAVSADGVEYRILFGDAVRTGAALTMAGFERGIGRGIGQAGARFGGYIVLLGVMLFAVSTAIAWSYYGDRCFYYLFGTRAVMPYRAVFTVMHFVGAIFPLAAIWDLGDVFLGIVILPNLIALILLAPKVVELTRSYFERRPWVENAEAHRRYVEETKRARRS